MSSGTLSEITILPGHDKHGNPEPFDQIVIRPGDTLSIVGPTGSGKTAFINDIEVFACNDTATGRTVLVNGEIPAEEFVRDPSKKPIALITQNTKCPCGHVCRGVSGPCMSRARKMSGSAIVAETNRAGQPVYRGADTCGLPYHGTLRGPDPLPHGGRRSPDQQCTPDPP